MAMLMMEALFIVCSIECVMATLLKPKLLKSEFMVINTKATSMWNSIFSNAIP